MTALIYDRIKDLCKQNGLAVSALEKELGIGNGTIGGWKTSSPTIEKLAAVAKFFNVSVDELIAEKGEDT